MSSGIVPLLTFKAGRCEGDTQPSCGNVKCLPTPGYIFVYVGLDDELVHFCWRRRDQDPAEAEIDLLMLPTDATFTPYTGKEASSSSDNVVSPTNGRIFVLKFSSSSQRYLFWLQSPSQHPDKQPNWFSPRDLKLGQIIDMMLSGEEVDVPHELSEIEPPNYSDRDEHPDTDNATGGNGSGRRGPRLRASSTGGAGAGASGGDFRDEGEGAREGGADGGRAASSSAPTNASALVQNLLNSLKGPSGPQSRSPSQFCSLADLLTPDICVPIISTAPSAFLDTLLHRLPSAVIMLETRPDDLSDAEPSPAEVSAAISGLSESQKRQVLIRVLRSVQLRQSLGSLTVAIREGGLPSVAEGLEIKVENGGFVKGGNVPLGGAEAVEAFVNGVRRTVKEEKQNDDSMETD